MKVVMTLLARNEADVIDAQLAFHLNAGVDFVIVTDNASDDGTTEILEAYAHRGHVYYTRPTDRNISQVEYATKMARTAATRFGADWVINSDADEFWWPRGGTLKEVLAAVPSRFGSIRGMWRHFVPRPRGEEFFADRMTVRLCRPVTHKLHPFGPHYKTAHRADPEVRVGGGNHDVSGHNLRLLPGWYPIDILHFPLRSLEQCEQKYLQHYEWRTGERLDSPAADPDEAFRRGRIDARMADACRAYREGRMREFYEADVVDDEALEQGLRDGKLAVDTRLRDALRSLGVDSDGTSSEFRTGSADAALSFGPAAADQGYLSELGTLEDHGAIAQIQRRATAFEARVSALERKFTSRVRARVRSRISAR